MAECNVSMVFHMYGEWGENLAKVREEVPGIEMVSESKLPQKCILRDTVLV